MAGAVRVFIATSLDGFIAGPDDDLSWLSPPRPDEDYGYGAFMSDTAAILMGRATYRVAAGFDAWPFEEVPVFVATTRPLDDAVAPTVHAIRGSAAELLALVRERVEGNVYLDGGSLIRQFLDAGLVDELTVTLIPVLLGSGSPLFSGTRRRHRLGLVSSRVCDGGIVQLVYRPAAGGQ